MTTEKSIDWLFAGSPDPFRITYKGLELIRVDHFPLLGARKLKLVLEATSSDWPQAVRILSDLPIEIDGQSSKNVAIWADAAPEEVVISCPGDQSHVLVYNAWDPCKTGKPFALLAYGAMIVEEIPQGRRYRCNDGYPDDDFDDLVFRIERLTD
ncbi:MAG: hypothetical protein HY690_13070 [Chloroflexi bacterium]|nr:hypothetical protein [Chloroflexota bacterium]